MRVVSRVEWGARAASLPTVAMTLPARDVWLHHTTSNVTSDPKRDMREVEAIGLQRFENVRIPLQQNLDRLPLINKPNVARQTE